MKKMLFSAMAMVAFSVSVSAQISNNPVTSNPCVQEGFKASDKATSEGKKGREIADAADKALKDCEAKKNSQTTTKQDLTLSRL